MSTLSIDTANYSLIGTQSYLIGASAGASSTITLYTDGNCTKQFGTSTTTSSSNKWYFSLSGISTGLYTVYAKEGTATSNGVPIYVYSGESGSNALYDYTNTNTISPPPSTYSGKKSSANITTPTITTSGLVTATTNNVTRYLFSTTPSISGTSDPYAMIELFYTSTAFGLTQANSAGNWTYAHDSAEWNLSSSIPTGYTSFIVRAYDEDYNYSSDAEIFVTIIDSTTITKPSTPVITSSFSSTVTTSNTVPIEGTCAKGTYDLSKVTLSYTSVSNTTYFIKTVDSTATTWSIDAYLPNGTYTLNATVTDSVGNESVSSISVSVTVNVSSETTTTEINSTISSADTASDVEVETTASDPSFASQVNGTVVVSNASTSTSTSTASITYSGFTPNTTITLYIQSDATYLGTYTTDANGTVIVTIDVATVSSLSTGVHSLSAYEPETNVVKTIPIIVVSTDANDSAVLTESSYVNTITSFNTADSVISGLAYTVGKIYITNKKITSISGYTTIPGTEVTITKSGVINTVISNSTDGTWTYTSSLSDGTYVISAAGATSTDKIITLIIDTIPPAKPTIQTTANNTISGTAEANANVIIRENNKVIKTVAASAQGNWFYKPDYAMPARPHTFSIVAQDAANNNSAANAFTNEFAFSMSKSVVRLVPGQAVNVNAITRKTISDPTLSFSISPATLPEGLKFNKHSGNISGTFTGTALPSQKYIVTTRSSVFVQKRFAVRMEMASP